MLLFTKLAPPKAPKRRSRAGCTFCKEKKKKCDEARPDCSRCAEKGLSCTYESIKPRQRRRRDSQPSLEGTSYLAEPRSPDHTEWDGETDDFEGTDVLSVLNSPLDAQSTFSFPTFSNSGLSPIDTEFDREDVNEEIETNALVRRSSATGLSPRSETLDIIMIAPSAAGLPTLDFCMPAFSEFADKTNRRALVDHFCNVLSHLIVFREESGNPFQQLVLPLASKSPPVLNAIFAMASAHLEYRGVKNLEKSVYFHQQAIQGLARLIESEPVDKNELLAAIMLLVYYEVLVQRGRSNIVDGHLKGALTIMASTQESSPTSVFLERAFRFYDVITALSLGTAPLSTAPGAGCLLPVPPMDAAPASPLSHVDTLLGMATTLWPIMHRLSNLLSLKDELDHALWTRQVSKIAVLRTEFETTSQAIETALRGWKPRLPPNVTVRDNKLESINGEVVPEKPRLQSILHNALAYRHSAEVYLYRTIYGYPPTHESVQKHAHAALEHCAETVAHKGPMGALLWPLFVAACEALSLEDRQLATEAFLEINKHQGMNNIEQAWGIILEVWKRRDVPPQSGTGTLYGTRDGDLWRRVSQEMGVNLVLG